MKPPNHPAIRAYLRGRSEGATPTEMATALGRTAVSVRKSLLSMPDVYIDRWTDPVRGQYQAIWCIVVPPANCPHPDDRHVHTAWNRKFFIPKEMRA